jgi:hypothetical protein
MTDKEPKLTVPDFETARQWAAEPGFFDRAVTELEKLRGQLPDRLVDDLLDGAKRLYERSKIPVDQIPDDDLLLERTEAVFLTMVLTDLVKSHFGLEFFVLNDLKEQKPDVYRLAVEIQQKLESRARRFSEILTLMIELTWVIRQARTGLNAPIYIETLTPLIGYLESYFQKAQLDALVAKVESQLSGKFEN